MKTSAYDWYPKLESTIDLGNDICRTIDDLLAQFHGVNLCGRQVKIKVEDNPSPRSSSSCVKL